jgi:hypothetical protein
MPDRNVYSILQEDPGLSEGLTHPQWCLVRCCRTNTVVRLRGAQGHYRWTVAVLGKHSSSDGCGPLMVAFYRLCNLSLSCYTFSRGKTLIRTSFWLVRFKRFFLWSCTGIDSILGSARSACIDRSSVDSFQPRVDLDLQDFQRCVHKADLVGLIKNHYGSRHIRNDVGT